MSAIQVAVPLDYDGKRYFDGDLQGALEYLWAELHHRAGGAERKTKPKAKFMWTANLRGLNHYYDLWLTMEADFEMKGDEVNGKQASS